MSYSCGENQAITPHAPTPEETSVQNITARPVVEVAGSDAAFVASEARTDVACLIFEADNVLFDATLWRRWLHQLLGRFRVQAEFEGFFERWERGYLVDVHRGRRDFDEALQAFLHSAGVTPAQFDEIEAASTAKRRDLAISTRLLPGVRTALWQLHRVGYRLAVLTNDERPGEQVAMQLERSGLGGLFEAVISSFDLERTLPDPAAFAAAMAAVGEPGERIAFVSNCARSLAGASALGLRTVSINARDNAAVDIHLDSISDFTTWMKPAEPCAALSS